MTTSISNASAETQATHTSSAQEARRARVREAFDERLPTTASRIIILLLCLAIILSTLAYGTVYYWSLAVFQTGAAAIIVFWAIDAWRTSYLRLSRNQLQWPLLGLILLGLIQLLPLGGVNHVGGVAATGSLSFDAYSTRLLVVQIFSLLIYFAAALVFIDSPQRLRLLVRVVIIFGFVLAIFGLIQNFASPTKVYGLRELGQSTAFGPFINRHHFAGYMEMTLALPLGLLLTGAVERDQRFLYGFCVLMMGIALVMTNSRGGIISLLAEVGFLFIITGFRRRGVAEEGEGASRAGRARQMIVRGGLALLLLLALFTGVVLLGGESVLNRLVGTVSAQDPTTGRAHFWGVTLQIIRHHPIIGTGLGSFAVAYTRYDTRNGMLRLEQAHNDYLQLLSDAGLIGALLGIFFVVTLFRKGFMRRETEDLYRRGVATGALAGCFAVLVHSFFDFTLHTTSNALLFLMLAALATLNGRVEQEDSGGHRRRRRRRSSHSSQLAGSAHRAPQLESGAGIER
jgi:O-antigen ligase